MMTFKLSLIFVELYCLFVVTKCFENSQFEISDVISDTSSYFYTTRDLSQQPSESTDEVPVEIVPVKAVYTLASDFVADLEALLHKITQTFVMIGQKKEGQKTLYLIYDEAFTIASNEISAGSLKYIMDGSLKVLQNPNSSKVVLEFFEMVQELMQYDLIDWHFVVPFLYDITRHPVPEKLLEKFDTELKYILLSEERTNSFAAALKILQDDYNIAAAETLKIIPITSSESTKTAVPVQIGTTGTATAGLAKSATQVPTKQVTQVPVKQVEQVTQIPVTKQVTQVPIKQVEQVTQIPVKQVESIQTVKEQVIPVQEETVVQSPAASESTASKVMRRVKAIPTYFKSNSNNNMEQGTN